MSVAGTVKVMKSKPNLDFIAAKEKEHPFHRNTTSTASSATSLASRKRSRWWSTANVSGPTSSPRIPKVTCTSSRWFDSEPGRFRCLQHEHPPTRRSTWVVARFVRVGVRAIHSQSQRKARLECRSEDKTPATTPYSTY